MQPNLSSGYGKSKIIEITKLKHAWDGDNTPLIDGSLANPGPFDKDTDTIASACKSSEGWKELQFIYTFVVAQKPRSVLELGTNVGVSAAYIGAALKAAGQHGRLHTIDASPYKMKLAQQLHSKLGLDNIDYTTGVFYDVLDAVLESVRPIDMAFIDGQHEYKATWDFFERITQVSNPNAVLLFDDIAGYSDGMKQAWQQIKADERVFATSELGNIGVVILGAGG